MTVIRDETGLAMAATTRAGCCIRCRGKVATRLICAGVTITTTSTRIICRNSAAVRSYICWNWRISKSCRIRICTLFICSILTGYTVRRTGCRIKILVMRFIIVGNLIGTTGRCPVAGFTRTDRIYSVEDILIRGINTAFCTITSWTTGKWAWRMEEVCIRAECVGTTSCCTPRSAIKGFSTI